MSDDAIPHPIYSDERSKRRTAEFCLAEHQGQRCMLGKGHGGAHESVAKAGALRWSTAVDSET